MKRRGEEGTAAGVPTKRSRRAGETVFRSPRGHLEANTGYQSPLIKQRGAIMLAFILDLIYRQFLRNSLSGNAQGRCQMRLGGPIKSGGSV